MSFTEHGIVLVSIVVGLGLTDLLGNFRRLVHARERVRWDGLPLAWALVALLLVVNYWWGLYLGATGIYEVETAGAFVASMVLPVVLYLVCSSALPEMVPAEGVDLGETYFRQRRFFFGLLLAYYVVVSIHTHIATDSWAWTPLDSMRAVFIAMLASLLVVRSRWYHWLAVLVAAGLLLVRLSMQGLD